MNKLKKLGLVTVALAGVGLAIPQATSLSPVAYAETIEDKEWKLTDYIYNDAWSNKVTIALENTTKDTKEYSITAKAKDSEGKTIGVTKESIYVVGAGQTAGATLYFFDIEDEIASVEYKVSGKKSSYYKDILSDLELEAEQIGNKVIVDVTNNGKKDAEFVTAHVVFLDAEGKIVGMDYTYIGDNDSEIKAGETETAELNTFGEEFHDFEIFLAGRADK